MLESMVHNPRPTRAETTDVANAIWDGTDIVMLSAETATGRYPVETVRTMHKIIEQAEVHPGFRWVLEKPTEPTTDAGAILHAVTKVCKPKLHKAIVTYTKSGSTAIALSKLRPQVPILALTPDERTYQLLSMIWGVRAFVSPQGRSVDRMIHLGDLVLMRKGLLKRKDRVILVAGTRLATGATNLLKIHQVGDLLS
jgi:pyruvate kinase